MIAVLITLCVVMQAAAQGVPAADWLLQYTGGSTNEVALDRRMGPLVNTRVPAKLSTRLREALGGPPDPVIVTDDRYVTISACVAHACPIKGFFWIDTTTGVGLGAVAQNWQFLGPHSLQFGSNGIAAARVPAVARQALIEWLAKNDLHPEKVEFVGRQGVWETLDATMFNRK